MDPIIPEYHYEPEVTPLSDLIANRATQAQEAEVLRYRSADNDSKNDIEEYIARGFLMNRNSDPVKNGGKELKSRRRLSAFKGESSEQKILKIPNLETIKKLAERRQGRFKELDPRLLLSIFDKLKPGMKKDEILQLLKSVLPDDPSLTSEVLEFLIECTAEELQEELKKAKEDLYRQSGREAKAGKNIAQQAEKYSQEGLGEAMSLRQLYREVTGTDREAQVLFDELLKKYDYEKMQGAIEFLLHSLGADMNAPGPSIERALLHKLMTEIRSLQAIMGVYRFFSQRFDMVARLAPRQGVTLPGSLNFQLLAKAFILFVGNRYPSAQKLLELAKELGISEDVMLEILIFSQYRDAMRYISPRLFSSTQHRYDVYLAILEALEELEQILDEQEVIEDEEEGEEQGDQEIGEGEPTEEYLKGDGARDLDDPFFSNEQTK
jgi:type III secretion protein W